MIDPKRKVEIINTHNRLKQLAKYKDANGEIAELAKAILVLYDNMYKACPRS